MNIIVHFGVSFVRYRVWHGITTVCVDDCYIGIHGGNRHDYYPAEFTTLDVTDWS